jgi:ATP-binding cassette, subfamily B, bacterial PglK
MLRTIKQAFDLVGREHPWRWALLAALALVVSALEMFGAVLVYTLLALIADPTGEIALPLVGDLRARFGAVDEAALLLWLVGIMAVFFVVRAVMKVVSRYLQARTAHNAGARLSRNLVQGYLLLPYSRHLTRTSSEFIRNGHGSVEWMVSTVILPAVTIVAEVMLVAGLVAVLLAVAPLAAAGAIVVVGSSAVVLLLIIQPRLKTLGLVRHQEAQTTLNALQQSLHGIRDVKLLGRERFFADAYGRSRFRMARAEYLRETAAQLPSIVLETAMLGFILAYFAVTIARGGAAQETLSVLGLFAYAGLRLQPSLQQVLVGFNNLKFSAATLDDLHADFVAIRQLDEPAREFDAPRPIRDVLAMEDVVFRYEQTDRPALSEINLTIEPGEQIGVCGPTGGGKTTLVDLVIGLLPPTAGRVAVDGEDVWDQLRAWQANIGVVSQMIFLTDDTLRRNIALGVPDDEIDEDAIVEAVRHAQLEEFVASLPAGLETTVGERGVRVSGGQRQRIAIARALYRRPQVLIFDEGTSALDNATEAELMRAIESLRGDHTVLLVAHRLSTVRNCDRVVFLEHGRISGIGPYDELRANNAAFRQMAGAAT